MSKRHTGAGQRHCHGNKDRRDGPTPARQARLLRNCLGAAIDVRLVKPHHLVAVELVQFVDPATGQQVDLVGIFS